MRILAAAILVFIGPYGSWAQTNCQCKYGADTIFKIQIESSLQLLVCGYLENEGNDNSSKTLTALTITDCPNNESIVNFAHDEIVPFTIWSNGDSLIFQNHIFLPLGEYWKESPIPFMSWSIIYPKSEAIISGGQLIFKYPELSATQIEKLLSLKGRVKDAIEKDAEKFPSDEIGIKMLFIGAFKGLPECKEVFYSMLDYFDFEGAMYETVQETRYQTLLEQ